MGREYPCKQVSLVCVAGARGVRTALGLPPLTVVACAFPVYTAQTPGCSAGQLSKAGPGLRARPRSKLLRFRFSGSPQRHGLGWACVLSPSQVRAAQVTRFLASTLSPGVRCVLSPPSSQPLSFPGCAVGALSRVCRVSPLGS